MADLCKFKVNLIYRVSPRTVRTKLRNPVSKNKQNKRILKETFVCRWSWHRWVWRMFLCMPVEARDLELELEVVVNCLL